MPVSDTTPAAQAVQLELHRAMTRCTHQAADLMRGHFDGDVIECPVHQGRFHVCTGAALSAPASTPLKTYPVKIEDGRIFVEV